MLNLIKNELYKIFTGKRIYVFMVILLVFQFIPLIEYATGALQDFPINGRSLPINMLNFLVTNIIPLFIIVMMSGMITDEYIGGTLKLSLLHPVSRSKLLTAKILALIVPTLVFLVFNMVISYLFGVAFFGWGHRFILKDVIDTPDSGILLTVLAYLISLLPSLVFGALVMLISLQFTSSGVAVGALLGLVIGMSMAGELLRGLQPFLIIYQLTFFKTVLFEKELTQTLLSLGVMAVYGLGSYLAALYQFNKRDILY